MHNIDRTSCVRCGTCCLKGGPALHHEDKAILLAGHVTHSHLVTVRKGELAYDPTVDGLRPVERELVKVRGKGNGWSCCFFDEKSASCLIYEDRFLECRLLKCWDPSELVSVIGKDTIVRTDVINPGDPIVQVIEMHERQCPGHEVEDLLAELSRETGKTGAQAISRLTKVVRKDLAIRFYAVSELGLKEEHENFIFGRPLFKVLASRGISVRLPADSLAAAYLNSNTS
ncbi:MAG: YkgJ family cysteine cluster protein [Ammonifex sp.]|nr:MAG: YkgJ family cysteine cluster protein [Ammonifex sp.]